MLSAEDYETEEELSPLTEEGFELMGAAFEVHRVIRGGLLEDIYQECLEEELRLRNIPFTPRQELAVFYKGRELRQRYIPDLYVHDEIVVELKSVRAIASEHVGQLLNYMRLARKPASPQVISSTSALSERSSGNASSSASSSSHGCYRPKRTVRDHPSEF